MSTLEYVFSHYRQKGDEDYIGESISQLEHMLQAATLAQQSGADDELILAAFFHDIGHLCAPPSTPQMDGLGVVDHEELGARLLTTVGFSSRIAQLVELHVQAKRYLCFQKPNYYQRLSSASKGTLHFQGGVMSSQEAAHFQQHPLFKDILRLRVWDEQAKVPNAPSLSLEELEERAIHHLQHCGEAK